MLATSKQSINNLFNSIDQEQEQNNNNNMDMNKESQINKNINSPEYNDYLNYSLDSPMATDSSTTPFSNNETANTNNSSLSSSIKQNINISNINNNNTDITNTNTNTTTTSNNNSDSKLSPMDNLIQHVNSIGPSTSNDYLINTPSISSPSLSSSTTKLNTANNSMNNLSKLNFRLNYITSNPTPNDINISNLPSSTSSNVQLTANHPNAIAISDGSMMAMEESPINNFSSPSVMNDLLDLLDAKETEKQQQQQHRQTHSGNKLFSPLQLINKINQSPSYIDDDSISHNNNNNNPKQHSNLPTLDENFSPHQYYTKDRRSSMVVNDNNIFPSLSDTRNSISHGVDFWNLNDDKSLGDDPISMRIDNEEEDDDNDNVDPTATTNTNSNDINLEDPAMLQSLDNTVSQVLNGYNMDFFKNNENSNINNNNNNNNDTATNTTDFNNFLYSPKQDVTRRQRSSMPSMSNRSIIDTLYEDITMNNSENNTNNTIKTPENNYKLGFDDENALLSDFDGEDLSMTPFKHNNTPTININDSSNDNNNNAEGLNNNSLLPNNVDDILNQLNDPSKETKFIKPSMMLSKKASMAAKLAIKGLPRLDTFPTIDFQPYNHPTRISKRKSVSSATSSGSNIHRNSFNSARRKSIIGVVRSPPSMSPTTSTNSTTATTTSSSSSQSKGNSLSGSSAPSNANFDNLEDKPFQCSDCPKAFKRSEHLKRHVRSVHSNERPFACTLCEKKFSRSDNLSQHLKTHKKHGDL